MATEKSTASSRTCARCKEIKPSTTEHFSPLKSRNMLHSWCKPCCAAERRADRAARPEHYAEIDRRNYERHTEKHNERSRKYYIANLDTVIAAIRIRNEKNRDKYNAARRKVLADNPELALERNARNLAWRTENADRVKATRRAAWKNASRHKRLRVSMGAAISHSLKGLSKGGNGWQKIAGYTTADLMAHLEQQFTRGMSWDNYGAGWHIDHIVPVSSFKYDSVEDVAFKACWALSNLRPLWAKDNLTKRNKLLFLI